MGLCSVLTREFGGKEVNQREKPHWFHRCAHSERLPLETGVKSHLQAQILLLLAKAFCHWGRGRNPTEPSILPWYKVEICRKVEEKPA